MKERSEGNRVRMERKRVSSTDVERIEEEVEAIVGTFALSQVVEMAYRARGIGDQVHRG
jgi:hypothetical protein